jgi:hypothetical protein
MTDMIDGLIEKYDYPELHLEQALERISAVALDLKNADNADSRCLDESRKQQRKIEELLKETKRAREKWTEFVEETYKFPMR